MKTFTVIHHDQITRANINFKPGYHVTTSKEAIRQVPTHAMIWTRENVQAENKEQALKYALQEEQAARQSKQRAKG